MSARRDGGRKTRHLTTEAQSHRDKKKEPGFPLRLCTTIPKSFAFLTTFLVSGFDSVRAVRIFCGFVSVSSVFSCSKSVFIRVHPWLKSFGCGSAALCLRCFSGKLPRNDRSISHAERVSA
jgi:hypothetical protein